MSYKYSNILWLITARSGSRSVPDKNIKELSGLPLFAYRVKAALALSHATDVWFSTDSTEYAELARQYGATIPFIRPAELASDNAKSSDVVLHAMEHAEARGNKFEYIGLLEPTSPFIYKADIDKAISKLQSDQDALGVVAVKSVRPHSYFTQTDTPYLEELSQKLSRLQHHNRQQLAPEITPSGGFYISKWEAFMEHKSFYTNRTLQYLVPTECELEIDEPIDWMWAEFLLAKNIIDLKKVFD